MYRIFRASLQLKPAIQAIRPSVLRSATMPVRSVRGVPSVVRPSIVKVPEIPGQSVRSILPVIKPAILGSTIFPTQPVRFFSSLPAQIALPAHSQAKKPLDIDGIKPYKLPQKILQSMKIAHDKIKEAVEYHLHEAQSNNKKFLLIIGENHNSQNCFILENMALLLGLDHKINQFIVELPPYGLPLIYNYPAHGYVNPRSGLQQKMRLLGYVVLHAKELGMQITAADVDVEFRRSDSEREAHMAAQCLKHSDNAIMMVGLGHMRALMTNSDLTNKYHILGVNASCNTPDEIRVGFEEDALNYDVELLESYAKSAEFALTDSRILQISLPTTDNQIILKPEEIISDVKQFYQARKTTEESQQTEQCKP